MRTRCIPWHELDLETMRAHRVFLLQDAFGVHPQRSNGEAN